MVGEDDLRYQGWRVAAASALGVFVGFASVFVYTFGIFLKPIAQEFNWSREAVSASFGFAAIMVAVASPAIGYLLDRYEPRRVILPCLLVFGLTFASLSTLTPHLWRLYATFALLGLVGNGTAQMAYARALSSWFEARRGTALAIMMAGGAFGAMVLPPLTQALIGKVGWRSACLFLGLLPLVAGLPGIAAFIRERPRPRVSQARTVAGASVAEGLASRVFWLTVIVLFCASIAQNGTIAHLAALLTDRGVSAGEAAIAMAAMGAASLVGRLVTGWLLDRFFAARVSFALLATAALGFFLLSNAQTFVQGAIGATLIGFGMGGEADVTPYLLARYFGLRSFSLLYGLTWTVYACAGAVGPILMGRVYDLSGSYERLLVVLALTTFAVGGLMLLLPPYGREAVEAPPVRDAEPAMTSAD
jgi:MFS family permease